MTRKRSLSDIVYDTAKPGEPHRCALCGYSGDRIGRVTGGPWQGGIIICFEHSFQFCFDLAESMVVALEMVKEERNGSGLS